MATISFLDLPRKCIEWITMVFLLITMLLDIGTPTATNGLELTNEKKLVLTDAMYAGQGITTDGEYYYTAGSMTGFNSNGLAKWDIATFDKVLVNYGAIPEDLNKEHKSNYIGGISYYNGYIYAPLEDSKKWEHPVVALYDAQTLEYTGICHEFSNEILTRGASWICVDGEKGFLYSSHSGDADEIFCFDLNTFEYVKSIKLSENVGSIQGGEVYDGTLYVGTNDNTRAVYTINTDNGQVDKLFDRIMYQPKWIDNFGGEGEDVTVFPMDDGTLVHTLDVGALFIDSNLRHYKIK